VEFTYAQTVFPGQENAGMGGASSGFLLLVVIAFVAGIAVGWLLAMRVKGLIRGSINVSTVPSGTATAMRTSWSGEAVKLTSKARTMELSCKCGSTWKFREPQEPGFEPFSTGDTFSCPNCGNVTDMQKVRNLVRDAQA
jgi:hypothetical protein